MQIKRDAYLQKLIDREGNGLVKIVTGIRRAGKSYLLFTLFKDWLKARGVKDSHIVEIALDDRRNASLRDPDALLRAVEARVRGRGRYFVLLDEVQFVPQFEDVLSSFLHFGNLDVYVTGSNSKFLSSDVITEFRGRGDEVRIRPLSFAEFRTAFRGTDEEAWYEYVTYGGLPYLMQLKHDEDKADYLQHLMKEVYLADIVERHCVRHEPELDELLDVMASTIGSSVNPLKIANTFKTVKGKNVSDKTISKYLSYLEDAFLLTRARRWNVKGRKYINSQDKWYFEDVGLRNARLNFRQHEENHIMENVIFNELRARGCRVDVGNVQIAERNANAQVVRKDLEIDFVASIGSRKWYVQSAYEMPVDAKRQQEERPLVHVRDSFPKMIVVKDAIKPWRDESGVLTIGVRDFLLRKELME